MSIGRYRKLQYKTPKGKTIKKNTVPLNIKPRSVATCQYPKLSDRCKTYQYGGAIELNPVMWLTIWRDHIDNFINKIDSEYITEENTPKNSTRYCYSRADSYSPEKKKKKHGNKARKKSNYQKRKIHTVLHKNVYLTNLNRLSTARRTTARPQTVGFSSPWKNRKINQ